MASVSSFAQLPEGHGRGGGDVERVYSVCHGNLDHIVGAFNHLACESVALGAHDDGQPRFCFQTGAVEGDGLVAKRHRDGFETKFAQGRDGRFEPRPRKKENGAHGDANGATVERVARGCR